ncbi:M1 family metallopeptidase [Actinocorallia lasiicapitis]
MVKRTLSLAVAAVSVVTLAPPAFAVDYRPGAAGVGDPYFPYEGNGGYDARHYALDLAYAPKTDRLSGTVTMTAEATQNLSSFNLDLKGLKVTKVLVNGRKAKFSRKGQELRITPSKGLRTGRKFTAAVTYGGVPKTIVGSPIVFGSPYGFLHTQDGAYVGAEPNAASTWFPVNDHPSDKATYTIKVTVPKGLGAVSNGLLSKKKTRGAKTTFTWNERAPMASYLATIDIGKWKVKSGRTPGGIRNYVAVDPKLAYTMNHYVRTTAAATDYWTKLLGPYPFQTTGAIVDNATYKGQELGFSLETQSKPVYSGMRDGSTIAHELAHQWFGNSVTGESWKDIWLNESFATWASWYWDEKKAGGQTAKSVARFVYDAYAKNHPYWKIVIADPKRNTMFDDRVYSGGAIVLQLLRERIGDKAFFELLRTWVADHRHGNATTGDFTALAQKVSGQDLTGFFQTWIYSPGKPALP